MFSDYFCTYWVCFLFCRKQISIFFIFLFNINIFKKCLVFKVFVSVKLEQFHLGGLVILTRIISKIKLPLPPPLPALADPDKPKFKVRLLRFSSSEGSATFAVCSLSCTGSTTLFPPLADWSCFYIKLYKIIYQDI